jgi:NADPH:quinone reductase-like Zn-dependent oxidoreductase
MKAIVQDKYGSTDVLELREVDKPVVGPTDVLIQVRAAGVNPADWALMLGLPYIARPTPFYGLRKPNRVVRGTDVAGRVEAVGSAVTRFRPGDEVFGWCNGSFAEFATAAEDALALKPANLSFEQAAAVPMAGSVAIQALRDQVRPAQKVLVNGASGGVGTFAVQIAKSLGAEVTGVCSTKNVGLLRSIGADHVIDYTRVDFTRNGKRYDLILDNIGNHSLSGLRRTLTANGTLVPNSGGFKNHWFASAGRLLRALAMFRFGSQTLRTFVASPKQEDLALLKDLIETGKVTPVLDRTRPLSEVAQAIDYVAGGHARGKVVITLSSSSPLVESRMERASQPVTAAGIA